MNSISNRPLAVVFSLATLVSGCCTARPPTAARAPQEPPLQALISGNQRYVQGHTIHPNQSAERRAEVASGQKPFAIILSCSDSRVPPELVFDQGISDLFVIRVAGNIVDDNELGSIEYAAEHLHVPLLVVLGHERCGAIQVAAAGGEVPGHVGGILAALQPALETARHQPGDLVDNAVNANVLHVVHQLETSDPILSRLVKDGKLRVVGARYSLDHGTVQILKP